jgi:hypothetical protein
MRAVAAAAPGALAAASLIAGTGFDGIDAAESFCACMPPDGAIAASPSYLLATVNTAFAIWDKSGHPLLGSPTSLSGLFGGCLATYPHMSDPFADYDAANQRFVLGILTYDDGYNSSLCLAVSQTSDPTAHWNVYSFPASSTPNNDLLDFPRAAIASNAIYVSGNLYHYQPGTPLCPNGFCFLGTGLYAYDKTQMYQGQPASSLGYTIAGFDSLAPARTVGISDPAYASGADYLTAADNTCSVVTCNTVRLWKWNAFAGAAPTYQGSVTVTDYGEPPDAVQPGTSATIDTNDARALGAYWAYDTVSGDTIYGAHTIGCNPGTGTVACVQWYRLGNLDATPVLLQQGIVAGNGEDRFYPNLAVDRAGDMTIAYAYSSGSEYAGIRYTGLASDDTPEPEAVLKAGEGTIDGSRYGDFAGEVVDPDGCTVWHFAEYARAGSLWGTWAGSFRFAGCAAPGPGASPSPTSTVALPAATAVPPTSTPPNTATPTAQAAASPTRAPTGADAPSPTATSTDTATPAVTARPTDIPSPTATAADTPSPTPAATAMGTASPDPTATEFASSTLTPAPTGAARPAP